MIRTQITFDREDYILAKQAAKDEGICFAEYVRRAVHRSLSPRGQKPWMRFAGMVDSTESLRREIAIGSAQADRGELINGKKVFTDIRKRSAEKKRPSP